MGKREWGDRREKKSRAVHILWKNIYVRKLKLKTRWQRRTGRFEEAMVRSWSRLSPRAHVWVLGSAAVGTCINVCGPSYQKGQVNVHCSGLPLETMWLSEGCNAVGGSEWPALSPETMWTFGLPESVVYGSHCLCLCPRPVLSPKAMEISLVCTAT